MDSKAQSGDKTGSWKNTILATLVIWASVDKETSRITPRLLIVNVKSTPSRARSQSSKPELASFSLIKLKDLKTQLKTSKLSHCVIETVQPLIFHYFILRVH